MLCLVFVSDFAVLCSHLHAPLMPTTVGKRAVCTKLQPLQLKLRVI